MRIDTSGWSGEGAFTAALLEALEAFDAIAFVKIEDAPASRAETGYTFLSHEIYVTFRTRRVLGSRRLGPLAIPWPAARAEMTLERLDHALSAGHGIGPADYADEGMLQYLKAERIVPPYQARGYKQVEMVRIYDAGRGRTTQGGGRRR
jgi:hypothetical protein